MTVTIERLTSAQAAKALSISQTILYALVHTGALVPFEPNGRGRGKRMYFDPAEIKAFAKGGAAGAAKYRAARPAEPTP